MSGVDTERVINNIISEVVQKCAARGHEVSGNLVAFMVKAVVLDPRNGFSVDYLLAQEEVQKLKKLCLEKLMEKSSLSLDTIKMQVYFNMNYTSRQDFLEDHRRLVESRLSPVSREITDSRVKTREEFDSLYRKIISYVLLRSSMGSSADAITVKEAAAALQSVFPQTELGGFMVLSKKEKEEQLIELTMLVTGIRLFNKATEKSREEADLCDLISAPLYETLTATGKSTENELRVAQSLAWKYTTVLEKLANPDSHPGDGEVELLRQALYNIRQHEAFLKLLMADACSCASHTDILQTELSSTMKLLKEAVGAKTAVHTAHVFPLFKALSKLWSGLQEEAERQKNLNNVMLSLQPYVASQAKLFPVAYLDGLLEVSEVKTDEQRMTESSDERIAPEEMKAQEWLLPDTIARFNELPLQYNGFCGHALVKRDGLLLPGNPHIGVLKHEDKLYAFSSKEAAMNFASSADDFVAEIAEKATICPELIHLLKLYQEFSCITPCFEMQPGESLQLKPKLITKCESGVQTDIHPMETNRVRSYEWNEWELRRKAIKLADLFSKATHSTQTDLSHMRRENATQTWLNKDAACQSKRDGESNMPKPHVFLAAKEGQNNDVWKFTPGIISNQLDAAVLCYNNSPVLRQQMKPDWRVHGIIEHGGMKPNVIPAYTELEYYLRTPSRAELLVLKEKDERCFRKKKKCLLSTADAAAGQHPTDC